MNRYSLSGYLWKKQQSSIPNKNNAYVLLPCLAFPPPLLLLKHLCYKVVPKFIVNAKKWAPIPHELAQPWPTILNIFILPNFVPGGVFWDWGVIFPFLFFWLNFSLVTVDCTCKEMGACTVNAKYMQVSSGLERTSQLWVKRDKTSHAQSEYVHITRSSQLAINPNSKLESFRV